MSQDTRALLADMLLATLRRDYRRLAAVQAQAGFLPPDQPRELYAQSLRAVCEPIFGQPLERISFARLLGQLLQLTESYQMPVQPELVLLQKNMLMAEGISRRLDPDLNIWLLAEPLIAEWVRENRGPAARAGRGGRGGGGHPRPPAGAGAPGRGPAGPPVGGARAGDGGTAGPPAPARRSGWPASPWPWRCLPCSTERAREPGRGTGRGISHLALRICRAGGLRHQCVRWLTYSTRS